MHTVSRTTISNYHAESHLFNGCVYKFYFNTKDSEYSGDDNWGAYTKGSGVPGNKNNYGMQNEADDYKYQLVDIDGHVFIVNTSGSIQHSASEYKEDGDTIIDARDAEYVSDGQWKYSVKDQSVLKGGTYVSVDAWMDVK